MGKIPVGETISGAYGFAFAGFLGVLGTVWLPYLLLAVIDGGVIYLISPDLPQRLLHGDIDMTFIDSFRRVQGLMSIVGFIIGAMIAVGLQERALGRTQGPTFFFFSLGTPVWRMVGALFLAYVALAFLFVITIGVTVGVCIALVKLVPHFGIALAVITGIAAFCWLVYATVRLLFFLPAVVVAEEHIGLVRAWELGAGNFWRIIAVVFVVFVPVAIGLQFIWGAVLGAFVPWDLFRHFHPGMAPGEINEFTLSIIKRLISEVRAALPFVLVLGVIQHLIYLGLGNGAIGKAYLGMTGKTA